MNDGEQLFPVSTEDWIRKKRSQIATSGFKNTPWPESSRQHTNKTRVTSLFQNYVAS